MAGVGDTMEDDLEDGEISSNSDSEMGASGADAAAAPPQGADAVGGVSGGFSGPAFQSRASSTTTAAAMPHFSATSYRGTAKTVDSSDSDSEDDEEAAVWRHKRQKVSNAPPPPPQTSSRAAFPSSQSAAPGGAGRKINNIWGSVVQEQCQESVAAELGIFGMEGGVSMASRNVETYNYVLARKIMEKEREEEEKIMEKEREQEEKEVNQGEVSMLDAQLDAYMNGKMADEDAGGGHSKRKRPPVKQRLGPRAEMDVKGRYEITEDDPDHSVIDEIAYRLQEPKKDLIERVVRVIGKRKAIELLGETATLEENGGVFTMDGSRRRTPGGVYLNLLKNTPSITGAQVRKVFQEETSEKVKSKKAAQKRRRHVVAKKMKQAIHTLNLQEDHDDGSRETFASDTNEALESLEDVAEEEDDEAEPTAVGIEETPVVYNAADLEVF